MSVQGHIRGPALNKFIIPPKTSIFDLGGEVARLRLAIISGVKVGLVVEMVAIFRKAAEQAGFVFVYFIPVRIIMTVNSVPDAFMPGQYGMRRF